MIIYGLLVIILELLKVLFGWLNLPDMPPELVVYIDNALSLISDGLPILWCYFDKNVVQVCLVIALACVAFDKVYDFLMWILAKLPIGINKE